jgi:hypothetical protein
MRPRRGGRELLCPKRVFRSTRSRLFQSDMKHQGGWNAHEVQSAHDQSLRAELQAAKPAPALSVGVPHGARHASHLD